MALRPISDWSLLRHVFFIINFGLALLLLAACVYSMIAMETPFSFLGGIVFCTPAAGIAVAEWIGWYRNRSSVTRVLAVCCLTFGGFTVFGVVANVAEAIQHGWPSGFEWFVAIGVCIALYFVTCGIYRLRSTRVSRHRPQLTGDTRDG